MKRVVLLAVLYVTLQSGLGPGWTEDRGPYTYTGASTCENPTRTVVVGLTMGQIWSGFPNKLMPSFNPSAWYDHLDVELPLYVTWIIDWDHTGEPPEPEEVSPPQALSSYDWFYGYHDQFHANVSQVLDDTDGYNSCAEGEGVEEPGYWATPLTSDGRLRVSDIHGGIGSITRVELVDHRCCQGGDALYYMVFQWDRPGYWYDAELGYPVEFIPGMVRHDLLYVSHGEEELESWMPTRIVQWVSADLGVPGAEGPSPRTVDSSDLAYFMSFLGDPIRWGFSTEDPPDSPTYQADVAPFTQPYGVDSSDLGVMCAALSDECALSKPGVPGEVAAILEWFGIAPTGRLVTVGPSGESLPGYEVVDWVQARRAIADPYGYRASLISTSPAEDIQWGLVKQLFR